MKKIETGFDGLYVLEPIVFGDDRGYFFESYNQNTLKTIGIETIFVQDNESKSSFGVVRGLHYQTPPMAMTKLLRVTKGEILDVVLDIRPDSATYGKHYVVVLSHENKKQLFIPRGFAHGFATLSETAVVNYKCDNFYSKEHDTGILWNDPSLNIDWQLNINDIKLSEKDKKQPRFENHKSFS